MMAVAQLVDHMPYKFNSIGSNPITSNGIPNVMRGAMTSAG